jgi:hypothetical protein
MKPQGKIAVAAAALLLLTGSAALAQQTQPTPNDRPSGTTSGPAAGTPAALGTGGEVPATPHQTDVLKNSGGETIKQEHQGQSGSAAPVQPGQTGSEAGQSPTVPKD